MTDEGLSDRATLNDRMGDLLRRLDMAPEGVARVELDTQLGGTFLEWVALGPALPYEPIRNASRALDVLGRLSAGQRAEGHHALTLARVMRGEATFDQLLTAAEQWVSVEQSAGDRARTAMALTYVASHHEWMGDAAAAEEGCKAAEEFLDEVPPQERGPWWHQSSDFVAQTRAHVLLLLHRSSEAAAAYLALRDPEGHGAFEADAASALTEAGRLAEARRVLNPVLARCVERDPAWARRAAVAAIDGDLLAAEGHVDRAVQQYEQALAWLDGAPEPDLMWQVRTGLARCRLTQSRPRDALDQYALAAEAALVTRGAPPSLRLENTAMVEKLVVFDEACKLAVQLDEPEVCCRLIEQVKAHSLSVLIASRLGPADGTARAAVAALSRRIDALSQPESNDADAEGQEALRRRRIRLIAARRRIIEQQRRQNPRWAAVSLRGDCDLEGIRALITAHGGAALSLFVAGDSVVSVLADRDGWIAGEMEDANALARVRRYADNVMSPRPVAGLLDPARCGIDLTDLVSPNLLSRALRARSLIVSPHRVLHAVPWPVVPCGQQRLVEQVPVGIAPNLACLEFLGTRADSAQEVVLVGAASGQAVSPALPGMADELQELWELYGCAPDSRPVEGPLATQAAVSEALALGSRRRTAHIALHGRLNTADPWACGLVTADGVLDAAELLGIPVGGQEVILSACCSAWRPDRLDDLELLADTVLAIPGALLEAGAGACLLSLTPADDASMRRLSLAFHNARRRGRSPILALAEAQRVLLSHQVPVWGWAGAVMYATC